MTRKSVFFVLLIVALLALGLSACNGSGQPASEPDPLTVQLSWFHSAEFAGFYIAEQLGYYAEENIAITLVEGGPEIDPIAEVSEGRAQFGVGASDGVIRARLAGQDAVAVASIFRQSPLVVMSLADSGIVTPADLVGKTVGVISPGLDTTWDIQFIAMLTKLGIDPASMTFVPNEAYHGAADLLSGRMDASSGNFATNEPIQAKIDNHPLNLMYYSDYGVEFYSNAIVTNGDWMRQNADLVERFIRATLRGYQYAIEHPDEASTQTLVYDPTLDAAFQQITMEVQIPLIDTGDAPIGWMDAAIWEDTQNILLDQGYIQATINLDQAYTNQFVEKVQQ